MGESHCNTTKCVLNQRDRAEGSSSEEDFGDRNSTRTRIESSDFLPRRRVFFTISVQESGRGDAFAWDNLVLETKKGLKQGLRDYRARRRYHLFFLLPTFVLMNNADHSLASRDKERRRDKQELNGVQKWSMVSQRSFWTKTRKKRNKILMTTTPRFKLYLIFFEKTVFYPNFLA